MKYVLQIILVSIITISIWGCKNLTPLTAGQRPITARPFLVTLARTHSVWSLLLDSSIAFADGNGDNIGDFTGMTQAIPYLLNLGVTAVWINPVFESTTSMDIAF